MKQGVSRPLLALGSVSSGALFSLGLVLAGMTQPRKVIDFLDITGRWDPSLGFVILGAILVHLPAYRWIRHRPAPLLEAEFKVSTVRTVDVRLILGAGIFGVGWGLSGYCPGPAIAALGSASARSVLFVVAMVVGMSVFHVLDEWIMSLRARGERERSVTPPHHSPSSS